ncbi:MAG: hypothetical protein U9O82_03910 [Thermodesulfobacteriota bacterium]|nr:hypothetical protein [Thermodesulfobacteriota bacterium]
MRKKIGIVTLLFLLVSMFAVFSLTSAKEAIKRPGSGFAFLPEILGFKIPGNAGSTPPGMAGGRMSLPSYGKVYIENYVTQWRGDKKYAVQGVQDRTMAFYPPFASTAFERKNTWIPQQPLLFLSQNINNDIFPSIIIPRVSPPSEPPEDDVYGFGTPSGFGGLSFSLGGLGAGVGLGPPIPIPGTVWLLAAGLAFLIFVKRSKYNAIEVSLCFTL